MRAREAAIKYCYPGDSSLIPRVAQPFSEFDQTFFASTPDGILSESDSDVLYPKLLDAELMTHNKYRSKYSKGVLPYPQHDMQAQPQLIREFCYDLLTRSVSMAKEVADTKAKRAKASG
jgi:hypothetical protein